MIKQKYPDLDFSDIDFSDMKGYEEEPPVSANAAPAQPIEDVPQTDEVVEVEDQGGVPGEGSNDNVAPE